MSAQVRSEYKLTEAGVIPHDWSCTSLATLVTSVASGRSKPDAIYGEYPVYGSTGIIGNTNNASHAGEVILVARVGANAGKLNLVTGKFGVTDNTIIIRLKDNLCLPFFYSQLERKHLNSLVFGSGQPLITGTQLKALAIPMPELHEQRIIAAALSDMDALISGLDQLIAKKRNIKQATMQQLLTGQKRLPGFSGEWKVKTLFEIAQRKKELFDDGDWIESEHITNQGVRLIQTGNIGIGRFTEKDVRKYIFEKSFTSLRCKELRYGDLLLCRLADPAGRACVLPDIGEDKIVTSVDVTIFRAPTDTIDRVFLSNLFSTPEWFRAVSDRSGGTTHKRISRGALGRISIKIPEVREQSAIAAILSDMDSELDTLETRYDKARQLKQAMMQELLTGRIRLFQNSQDANPC